jgi:hypothetical protein
MTTNLQMLRAKPGDSLTLEEMRRSLPSIFAEEPHHSRSERYVYVSTEEMLERLMNGGFLPVEARTANARDVSRRPFTKHMIRFRGKDELLKPDNSYVTKRGDPGVAYEVILRNAHDGSGSYQMLAGLIRFACENGLVVSDGTVASIKVLHMGNRERLLSTVLNSAEAVLEQGPAVGEKIQRWRGTILTPEEGLALARASHKARFADGNGNIRTPITPEQLLIPRRDADAGRSLWDVFNVVQENVVRGGLSADGRDASGRLRRRTSRAIRGIDDDLRINRHLWALAERSAELKAARKPALDLELAA